jgi:hypothetical protein
MLLLLWQGMLCTLGLHMPGFTSPLYRCPAIARHPQYASWFAHAWFTSHLPQDGIRSLLLLPSPGRWRNAIG